MIGNIELILNNDTSLTYTIKLVDNHYIQAFEKGVVSVITKQNEVKVVHDVYYVPSLSHNLISVGQLTKNGYKVIFDDVSCTILGKLPNREIAAKVHMTPNRLFPLEMQSANLQVHNISNTIKIVLWHNWYSHLPYQSLNKLQKKSLVQGLPSLIEKIPPCEIFIIGKHKRDSFAKIIEQMIVWKLCTQICADPCKPPH